MFFWIRLTYYILFWCIFGWTMPCKNIWTTLQQLFLLVQGTGWCNPLYGLFVNISRTREWIWLMVGMVIHMPYKIIFGLCQLTGAMTNRRIESGGCWDLLHLGEMYCSPAFVYPSHAGKMFWITYMKQIKFPQGHGNARSCVNGAVSVVPPSSIQKSQFCQFSYPEHRDNCLK